MLSQAWGEIDVPAIDQRPGDFFRNQDIIAFCIFSPIVNIRGLYSSLIVFITPHRIRSLKCKSLSYEDTKLQVLSLLGLSITNEILQHNAIAGMKSNSTIQGGRILLLDDLRKDLTGKLIGYKMPTIIQIKEGKLPKGWSRKVLKRELGPKLFPLEKWYKCSDIQKSG